MATPIVERNVIVATNADILNGTRLNAIPYNGTLTFEVMANLANATNRYTMTIQLPNGDVPVDSQTVPAGQEVDGALGGQLDDRLLFRMSFPAFQGGHFNISLTETGTAVCTWQAVLR